MSEGRLLDRETQALVDWQREVLDAHNDRFEAAKELTQRLGGHWRDGHAEFGFWTPELENVPADEIRLELLTPATDVDPGDPPESATFERVTVDTRREGEFTWAAVEGVRAGTRDELGTLYQLVYEHDGERGTVTDPLAASVPFGVFAPPELYDLDRLDETRPDRDYFRALGTDDEPVPTTDDDGLPRIDPATSMVEMHPGTATEAGSLGGLARRLDGIAERERGGEALSAADENFLGYDAVQLMPVEPITENGDEPGHWRPQARTDDELVVDLAKPEMVNWGYDIVVGGFSAVNPAILETGRPDELVDFIAACHAMPRPLKVVFDVALGHADNGGLRVLNERYFSGPGMYGQDLDYTEPVVRAVLLELQRRKLDFGADGIRVDGAQDFTNWDEDRGEWHDDAFLAEMDAVTQEVAGTEYRPWMIYEDGRPWPREDWELASTYRTLIEQHPHSFQWSPITFAHNTPALLTFWATKWWRVREVADMGSQWITGVANHDTVRRGTQRAVPDSWEDGDPINPYLGENPRETLDRAYDNPATNALMHCFLPGVPMDFLNANHRGPWGFVRDTDEDWNVKVVADEHNLVEWQVADEHFDDERFFSRIKSLGFESRDDLAEFVHAMARVGEATDFDHAAMAEMLTALDVPLGDGEPTAADLQAFSFAWMRDVHEFATLDHWRDAQDPERTAFDRAVREFRHERPWLRHDLTDEETFGYRHPTDGTVVYYGHRVGPDEELLFVANMEGMETTVTPTDLVGVAGDGWEVALTAPDAEVEVADGPVTLPNAAMVVFSR
ncbi:glucosylglycerol hydrolase [Halorarius litoreus]|uniref:glucosylglycerol hydrolase n=1 Tax=Halorarius litoreus TaxID=2962676 RepID=UPI0020CFAD46|nr:glucosylglycerol hydrolase [Halorarius litoreus]